MNSLKHNPRAHRHFFGLLPYASYSEKNTDTFSFQNFSCFVQLNLV